MIETVQAERRKQRKRTTAALLAALLIHLLIVLAAFVLLSLKPAWIPRAGPRAEPPPVELTMMPPPEPSPPPKKKERDFFDSSQGNVSEQAPDAAAFESDRNTTAASERPAQSDAPVPTQDGDEAPGLTLETKNLSLGPVKPPAAPSPDSPARAERKAAEKTAAEKPTEKKTAEAKTEPTPRPTPKPDDSELALLDPAKPPPAPKPPVPEVRKPQKASPPTRANPPAFQPQQRLTRLTGGIDSRGRSSVNSVATPLGRYKKMISDAIGSRWYYYVQDMLDLVGIGTVQLRFVVDSSGKVERVQVLKNTSNESLASCSVRSIIEAEIPPIPRELAGTLPAGKLEVDYSFTIVGQ